MTAVARQTLERYRQASPAADALLQKAAGGDQAAAQTIAQQTKLSKTEVLDVARSFAEGLVWQLGSGGAKALADTLSHKTFSPTSGGLAAGNTVRHLGGFKDLVLAGSKNDPALAGLTQSARVAIQLLVRHEAAFAGGRVDDTVKNSAQVALRAAFLPPDADNAAIAAVVGQRCPHLLASLPNALIGTDKGSVVFVDTRGAVQTVAVDRDNVAGVLKSVKESDLARGAAGGKAPSSYALRQALLIAGKGGVASADAFTWQPVPQAGKKAFLDQPQSWLPERQALHKELIAEAAQKALSFHGVAATDVATVFCMRGNTAAGKSRTIPQAEQLAQAADHLKAESRAALNPDHFKSDLITADKDLLGKSMTFPAAHDESTTLARALWRDLETQPVSLLIDRRLGTVDDVTEITRSAKGNNKKVQILDIEASLEFSLTGVLTRKPGGGDPIPPFDAIAHGFREVRHERLAMMNEVLKDPTVERYDLFMTSPTGEKTTIATMRGDQFTILDQAGFDAATSPPEEEIKKTGGRIIDDAFVATVVGRFSGGFAHVMKQALERYKGLSLQAAVDAHSQQG